MDCQCQRSMPKVPSHVATGSPLQDAWGYTPLHWAAARGKAETVALLVARDANMEAMTYMTELHSRLTAADTAAGNGNRGIAAFLGEQQLQQSVLKLKEASTSSPGVWPCVA